MVSITTQDIYGGFFCHGKFHFFLNHSWLPCDPCDCWQFKEYEILAIFEKKRRKKQFHQIFLGFEINLGTIKLLVTKLCIFRNMSNSITLTTMHTQQNEYTVLTRVKSHPILTWNIFQIWGGTLLESGDFWNFVNRSKNMF